MTPLTDALTSRLHQAAHAQRWGVSVPAFAAALERSVAKLGGGADGAAVERHLDGLHLEDLALACACAAGHAGAWEHFIETYRPALYRAADALDPGGGAREAADALYGELYGVRGGASGRRSLFDYFHGRSRLGTWLRSILAQRHVDRIRAARKTRPLDEEDEALPERPAAAVEEQPDRLRFARLAQRALGAAILGLEPADRLRLSFYYLQRLTLAQIGRLTGEHEATVSRRLDRIRRSLRADVERRLREEDGLGEAEVRACVECALEDVGLDLDQWLSRPATKPGGEQETVRGSF